MQPPIASIPEIDAMLVRNIPVCVGVSGGKDSQAAAIATYAYLDRLGHTGPRLLIHSDLGAIEWMQSLPVCKDLAAHLNTELVVVSRIAGGMIERWEERWKSSVGRWSRLETVTVVPPWSTPAMRFCTSELKTSLIVRELKKRFGGNDYVNVTGVRRQESAARAKGSVANLDTKGHWNWRPISDWTVDQVFSCIEAAGLQPHEAYTAHGLSRVSCVYCIMSSQADLAAAARAAETEGVYLRLSQLEARSTFGFQGEKRWLADVRPDLLPSDLKGEIAEAKVKAAARKASEGRLSKDMLFVSGWPVRMLTDDEADILAGVRREISDLLDIPTPFTDRASIHDRYAELIVKREERDARRVAKHRSEIELFNLAPDTPLQPEQEARYDDIPETVYAP